MMHEMAASELARTCPGPFQASTRDSNGSCPWSWKASSGRCHEQEAEPRLTHTPRAVERVHQAELAVVLAHGSKHSCDRLRATSLVVGKQLAHQNNAGHAIIVAAMPLCTTRLDSKGCKNANTALQLAIEAWHTC